MTATKEGLHPYWGLVVAAVLIWHGVGISLAVSPHYLLSVCYVANIILAAGILARSSLLTGIGFGWAVVALPLWIINLFATGQVMISSLALHTTGLSLGFLFFRHKTMPRWLVAAAIPSALVPYLLGRVLTDPRYNINAAFRVQNGWQSVFTDFHLYLLTQLAVFSLFFLALPAVSNRYIYIGDGK